jgi:hypothetical protein
LSRSARACFASTRIVVACSGSHGARRTREERVANQREQSSRKYYMLTARGRKALSDESETWNRQAAAIARIMEA